MKITIEAKTLADGLATVRHAVARASSIDSLRGVVIDAGPGRFHLTTTDMQTAIRRRLDGTVEGELRALVNHAELVKAAKAMNGRTISLTIGDDRLRLDGGKRKIDLSLIEDFPTVTAFDPERVFVTGPATALAPALAKAAAFVSQDDTRPYICAAELEIGDGPRSSTGGKILPDGARLISTDSFRLGLVPLAEVETGEPGAMRIHRDLLDIAPKLMKGAQRVEIRGDVERQRAVIDIDGHTLIGGVSEGRTPNWRQLIPDEHAFNFEVAFPSKALLEAATVANGFSSKYSGATLTLNSVVKLTAGDFGAAQIEEEIDGATFKALNFRADGDLPLEIGFNPGFLADIAKQLGGEEIRCRVISSLKPGYFEGEHDRVLLMPTRLKK